MLNIQLFGGFSLRYADTILTLRARGSRALFAYLAAGGAAPISDGIESYNQLFLEPGSYIMVCRIPSSCNEGTPHPMLDTMQELTVE